MSVEIIESYGYEVGEILGEGSFGTVYRALEGSHPVAVKFIQRGVDPVNEFRKRATEEYEKGREMGKRKIGVPVRNLHLHDDYALIVMELGKPFNAEMSLDYTYFLEVFKKIDKINYLENWCVDFKPQNAVMWKGKPYLIDFDEDFCHYSSLKFWDEWNHLVNHYFDGHDRIQKNQVLTFFNIDRQSHPRLHPRFENRKWIVKRLAAQCYIFVMMAKYYTRGGVNGYIEALHDVIYVSDSDARPRLQETKVQNQFTGTGRVKTPRRRHIKPNKENRTWGDTLKAAAKAATEYLGFGENRARPRRIPNPKSKGRTKVIISPATERRPQRRRSPKSRRRQTTKRSTPPLVGGSQTLRKNTLLRKNTPQTNILRLRRNILNAEREDGVRRIHTRREYNRMLQQHL